MALTKIGSIGINTGIQFAGVTTIATLNASDNVLSVGGTVNFVSDVSIGGSVSIGGTLTYEDVTNIDSVGLITARNGIVVGSGITLSSDGDIFATGITTVSGNVKVGSGITLSPDGHAFVAGVSTIGTLSVSGIVTGTGAVDPSTGTITSSGNITLDGSSGGGRHVKIGNGRTSNSNSFIDLIGDSTYSTYGARFIRSSDGANASTSIQHRGTGTLSLTAVDAGMIQLATDNQYRLRITSNGRVLIGDTTARGFDGGNTPLFQVSDNTSGRWARIASATYIDSTIGGGIILAHSRNSTVGSHTILQDDDKLGSVFFEGSDGTQFARGAQIQAYVDGTPGTDDMPGRIEFGTTADGASSPTTNLVLDSSGRLIAAAGRVTPRTNFKDINGDTSTPSFQFETANSDSAHSLSLTFGRNNSHGPELKLAKHRSATIGGADIVQTDDELGCISFLGSDGTNFIPAASIRGVVNLGPGTNDMPGAIRFATTADGAAVTTDHWQINRSGILDALHSTASIRFLQGHSVTANDATVVNNTLNDYEEGTLDWEIHKSDYLTTGNNSGSQVTYQKIGSMVYIQGHIRTDGTSPAGVSGKTATLTDASGNRAQLPFTPSASGSLAVTHTRSFQNSTTTTFAIGWAGSNDDLYVYGNQGNHYTPTADNVTLNNQTNVCITFSGHYHTND